MELGLFIQIYNYTITSYFSLFLGFVETGAIIGPLFGLLLASFCANVYVDIGSVNTGNSLKSSYTMSRVRKAISGMRSPLIGALLDFQLDKLTILSRSAN